MNDRKPESKDGLQFKEVGQEWFVYDPQDDKVHVLNYTASVILKLCDGTRLVGEIEDALRVEFPDAPADRLQKDLLGAIKELQDKGLVRVTT